MSALRRAWGRFRRLPSAAQALAGVILLVAYTVALVVLLTGGGDDDEQERRPLSALERDVKALVESGEVPQQDVTDVAAFRKASVTSSRCEDTTCDVTYSIAVPGGGRVRIQQVDIVAKIFGETKVEKLTLEVVRGQPTGPRASPKTTEETPIGVPLYETECDRSKASSGTDWNRYGSALAAFEAACETRDVFEAGPGGGPGAPGTGGGGGE